MKKAVIVIGLQNQGLSVIKISKKEIIKISEIHDISLNNKCSLVNIMQ